MEHILESSERQHDWEEVLAPKVSVISDNKPVRKIICRYGRGCTHIYDSVHKERFWHPPCPSLNVDQVRTHYICNECGVGFVALHELQRHLQMKTAWSNNSLIGSRVSCLVDSKEWHEGIVTQFHPKSGKHYVEFRAIGEKRWFSMVKVAFYIIERPQETNPSEVKEMDAGDQEYTSHTNNASDDNWTMMEDISLDYAFAQSVLFKIYGAVIQETGHKTRGHVCLTPDDRDSVKTTKGSLLYGELLPRGANRAFDMSHLHCATASVLFDLGCGTGKVAIQAFLQYRNLQYVCGVEISGGRYSVAEEAVIQLVELLGEDGFVVDLRRGSSITIRERSLDGEESYGTGRTLRIECGNMMDVKDLFRADIVMLETDIPLELQSQLCALLQYMPEGSRTLTYLDLRKIWDLGVFPFKQLESNRSLTDRFPTSWSVQRGHHFYIWNKMQRTSSGNTARTAAGNWATMSPNRPHSQVPDNEEAQQQQAGTRTRHPGGGGGGGHDSDGCLPFLFSSSWKSNGGWQQKEDPQPSTLPPVHAAVPQREASVRKGSGRELPALPPVSSAVTAARRDAGTLGRADDDGGSTQRNGGGGGVDRSSRMSGNNSVPRTAAALGYGAGDDAGVPPITHSSSTSPPGTAQGRRASPRTVLVTPKSPDADLCADSPEREWGRERRREVRVSRRQQNVAPGGEVPVHRGDTVKGHSTKHLYKEPLSGRSETSAAPVATSKSTCVIS